MGNLNGTVNASTLRSWLENKEDIFILDIRPLSQRMEWKIPGSHFLDAYKRLNEGDYSVLNEADIPGHGKVVIVCAAGKTSQIAANALGKKGFDAYSLEGGMKAWSTAWNIAEMSFNDFNVAQVRRTGKGCLSYIVSSQRDAVIIDASAPEEVYIQYIHEHNLTVKNVTETHIHADHLSRSKRLADYFNVPLYLPVPNKVKFPFSQITSETILPVGKITINTVPTPGHTWESVSFYVEGCAVFTGDTVFVDGVGRPDLKANEDESHERAILLFRSLRKLLSFPDSMLILPAHTSKPVEFDGAMICATIAEVKKNIHLLQLEENAFVDTLLRNIPPAPNNYYTIVERNLEGNFSDIDPLELEAGANRCAIS